MATATPTRLTAEFVAALAAAPVADLLTQAYHLTHQLHEQENVHVRAHRDAITAEVLRRAGE